MRHCFGLRIYYEDTDAGGIVYHANYLRFAERARTEWLRGIGFDHPTLLDRLGVMFAVRRCDATFFAPAKLDDEIYVETSHVRTQGARVHLDQVILRGEQRLVTVAVELVLVDRRLRPSRLPAELKGALGPPVPHDEC
ncbi:MAG TPA: tol-pal system-associated acyl-CoA thioesterase [Geminicoccus sp.]|jgi:acyl-CoA thioester hydrolase|uniref:tol-pal system-associated acyl-CoA thioesterase n=1 Tax=Geminicoccus sp. TaxID=2024832 RepID=UPI002E3146F7|nr:tol-pal system-associated acyl-CoA thioesterase [Geminicoccus sp.]HEX2528088.1 tol-pal system-associated acyl-CoA thioesterase [Geminicoccus sp.]